MKLSLVVPCYNEEGNIALFYKEAMNVFSKSGFDYEIVFVNDGSTDSTSEILKKLVSGPIPVKIINFSRNFGKEAAMLAGLENTDGDYVTIIDADLQQRPEVVLEMLDRLEADPKLDCVATYQENRNESKALSFLKKSFYNIINGVSDTKFVNGASDFRTFRRTMVNAIINMKEYFRFSKGIFSWVGFNTEYIPYTVEERASGESKWSFAKLFKYAVDGIESFTTAPLRIPMLLGLLFIILSLPLFIILCIVGVYIDIAVMFFVGGTILACIGLIGEYLAKAYIQGKNRPVYIIKEIISNQ